MTTLSRRDLLTAGAAAAVVTQLPWPRPAHAQSTEVGNAEWQELAGQIAGRVVRPGDPEYAAKYAVANTRYRGTTPEGIVFPANEGDVVKVVKWVRKHHVPIVARGGGHNYAGYSATEGLLLHFGDMKGASLDTGAGRVTVQAGFQNGDGMEALRSTGLTLPFGRCPAVGVSGYVLGGGVGLYTRRFGMGCDKLQSTRVVTSSGDIVVASPTSNSDLFWACQGGAGGNFGINTEYTLKVETGPDAAIFSLTWNGNKAEELLLAVQNLILDPALKRMLEVQCGVKTRGRTAIEARQNVSVYAEGRYYGSQAALMNVLQPLLAVAAPQTTYYAELSNAASLDFFSASGGSDPYLATSVVADQAMTSADAYRIVESVRSWPGSGVNGTGCSVSMFAMGGADTDLNPSDTAFVHRRSKFIMSGTTYWSQNDPFLVPTLGTTWINTFRGEMSNRLGDGAFVNFPGATMPHWWNAYYGTNYSRLVDVKEKYDPVNLFRYGQSVRRHPWFDYPVTASAITLPTAIRTGSGLAQLQLG